MTKFKDMKSLVITRYDRRVDLKKKAIIRLPQEDLCQALGYNSSKKYENEGGPGIIEIMDFLDSSNERERDRHSFLKAQIIFQLLGAIDGHAKNFSVLLGPGGMVLAPIYDVMTVYLALQENQVQFKDLKLSMKVGDGKTYNLRYITRKHWFKTAARCHFPQQELEGIFKDLNEKLKKLPQRPFALPRGFPQSLYQATLRHIEKARRRLLGP
jgi:serine/threonine-protein kinase HipA